MAPFIESVLDQVKGDLAEALSVEKIEQICRELNYSWRECVLDPATTVHAFLRQVLAGNTACDHVPHLTGLPVTGEAYCKARSRLPVELFQRLMSEVAEKAMQGDEAAARWECSCTSLCSHFAGCKTPQLSHSTLTDFRFSSTTPTSNHVTHSEARNERQVHASNSVAVLFVIHRKRCRAKVDFGLSFGDQARRGPGHVAENSDRTDPPRHKNAGRNSQRA